MKKVPRSRPVGLDKCFEVYDMKMAGKTWKEIAVELYKPRGTEKELNRAKEKVRKQFDTADRLINHYGWRYLWEDCWKDVKIPF